MLGLGMARQPIFQVMLAEKVLSNGRTSGPRQAKIGEDKREALDLAENRNESGEACAGSMKVA
jgi:hypothetical protein